MPACLDGGRRGVFLDRDGVLNRPVVRDGRPFAPSSTAALEILPGAARACRRLQQAGFILVVVTNQPDIARGTLRATEAEAINDLLRASVGVDDVRMCPHDERDRCGCRKPAPGLILQAARDYGIALSRSFMVGDRWRDIEAGRRAGCSTVLVDCRWNERRPDHPDTTVRDVVEAAEVICARALTKEIV